MVHLSLSRNHQVLLTWSKCSRNPPAAALCWMQADGNAPAGTRHSEATQQHRSADPAFGNLPLLVAFQTEMCSVSCRTEGRGSSAVAAVGGGSASAGLMCVGTAQRGHGRNAQWSECFSSAPRAGLTALRSLKLAQGIEKGFSQ